MSFASLRSTPVYRSAGSDARKSPALAPMRVPSMDLAAFMNLKSTAIVSPVAQTRSSSRYAPLSLHAPYPSFLYCPASLFVLHYSP